MEEKLPLPRVENTGESDLPALSAFLMALQEALLGMPSGPADDASIRAEISRLKALAKRLQIRELELEEARRRMEGRWLLFTEEALPKLEARASASGLKNVFEFQSLLEELKRILLRPREKNEGAEQEQALLAQEILRLQSESIRLLEEKKRMSVEFSPLQERCQRLEAENRSLQDSISAAQAEAAALRAEKERLGRDLNESRKRELSADWDQAQLKSQDDELRASRMQEELRRWDRTRESLEDQLRAARSAAAARLQENEGLKSELERAQQARGRLSSEISGLRAALEISRAELEKLQATLASAAIEHSEELERERKSQRAREEKLRQEAQRQLREQAALQKALGEAQEGRKALEEESQSLRVRLDAAALQFQKISSALELKEKELAQTLELHRSELGQAAQFQARQLGQLSEEKERLELELRQTARKLQDLEARLPSLEEALAGALRAQEGLKEELRLSLEQRKSQQERLRELEERLEVNSARRQRLEAELALAQERILALETNAASLEKQLGGLGGVRLEAEAARRQLAAGLRRLQESQGEIDRLRECLAKEHEAHEECLRRLEENATEADVAALLKPLLARVQRSLSDLKRVAGVLPTASRSAAAPALSRLSGVHDRLRTLSELFSPADPAEPASAASLVESALVPWEAAFKQRRIALTRQFSPSLPMIRVQAGRLRLAVYQLLKNAYEAMPAGGSLRVSLARVETEAAIRLRIHDSGRGFPPALLLEESRPLREITASRPGIGLAAARKIAEGFGGRLVLGNENGGRAELILPHV